ncbi:MAG: outer membrane lipoprotein-sorting protein [Verrucomicrobiota bacterium]|nr:outer membrane lipoprotein-sorting protein [Verrucomicrobiota bacterium]
MAAFALAVSTVLAQETAPDAREILETARLGQTVQHRVLVGQLRNDDRIAPFRLVLNGSEIHYEFSEPDEALILKLGENQSRLDIERGGKRAPVSHFDEKVRGSDITYEDLALRFLYWPVAKVEGDQVILTRRCWKLRLEPGSVQSQYGMVILWVEKQSGALLRADCYDRAGNFSKRFEVRSVQKIDGGWLLKRMSISQMENGRAVDKSPTYLEIEGNADQVSR